MATADYSKAKSRNKCPNCGTKVINTIRCKPCLKKMNQKRLERQEQGMCRTHNVKAIRGGKCQRCLWYSAEYGLKRSFDITTEDYARMELAQERRCAICKEKSTKLSLAVDHNHGTLKIRGLLCGPCNVSLGVLNSKQKLTAAIEYLEKAGE